MTDTQQGAAPTAPSAQPQSVARLAVALIVGGITSILDTTIVTLGLHTLTQELHTSVSTSQWVSTGYLLALAVAIPFVSWAQARFGGKRLWLFALGLFVVGSALCACAWDIDALIAFRILQGFGGGIMMPLMMTLAMQNVDPSTRTRTMATMSLPAALGPILGPVLAGIVLNWLSWRWLFLINVPLGVLGWILAMLFLVDDRPARGVPRGRLDIVGAVLLAPALAGLLYGLSNTHDTGGFARTDVLLPVIAGALLLAAFVWWALRRSDAALVDLRLLGVRSVCTSSIALLLIGAALFAGNFLLPLYFQTLRGYSALNAAFLLIPQGAGALLARFLAGKLVDRFGPRVIAVAGAVVMAAATVPFALAGVSTSLWYLGVILFIRGLGNGVVFIPIMTVAYVDITRSQMADASAITRISQQLGGAFGTALVAVVLTTAASPAHPAGGFDAAFWWVIAMTAGAALACLVIPGRAEHTTPAAPAPVAQ